MHGDYLVKTDEALSKRGGSGDDGSTGSDGGSGGATGNAIVDYAMGYVGYPYVWATHGPSSFDCSGFTYWVIKNVVGIDIATACGRRSAPARRSAAATCSRATWSSPEHVQVGPVALRHLHRQRPVRHAENETTGVKVSDLNSNYYGSRWYGAVRIG